MARLASLPMYATGGTVVEDFWHGLRRHCAGHGIADLPEEIDRPTDLVAHWLSPDLLLSQTCGYPLTTTLAGRVRYLATPCYDAPGCEGPFYRSVVVVRSDDPAPNLAALAGRRAAFNGRDSQSGHNALRALVAPLAKGRPFFAAVVETGAHRASVAAVATGRADIAAIDVVTFALLRAAGDRDALALRVLTTTAPVPGLPFVTAATTSDEEVTRLRGALEAACRDPALALCRRSMLLTGIVDLPLSAYDAILAMERRATGLGYPALA